MKIPGKSLVLQLTVFVHPKRIVSVSLNTHSYIGTPNVFPQDGYRSFSKWWMTYMFETHFTRLKANTFTLNIYFHRPPKLNKYSYFLDTLPINCTMFYWIETVFLIMIFNKLFTSHIDTFSKMYACLVLLLYIFYTVMLFFI